MRVKEMPGQAGSLRRTLLGLCLLLALPLPAIAEDADLARRYHSIHGLIDNGAYTEAEAEARAFLAQVETEHGSNSPQAAFVLGVLVRALVAHGRVDAEVRALAKKAVAINESAAEPNQMSLAYSYLMLAGVHLEAEEWAQALPLSERAQSLAEASLPPTHPYLAVYLDGLGWALYRTGEYSEARQVLDRALAIREESLGPDHIVLGFTLNNLGHLLMDMGELDEARKFFERALAIRSNGLPPSHPDLATSHDSLGILRWRIADNNQARASLLKALEIRERSLGPNHTGVAATLTNLGLLYRDMGDLVESRRFFERSSEIRRLKGLPTTAQDSNLALVFLRLGDFTEAERLCTGVLDVQKESLGSDHPKLAETLNYLGAIRASAGNIAAAEQAYLDARSILVNSAESDPRVGLGSLFHLGRLYLRQGDIARAIPIIEQGQRGARTPTWMMLFALLLKDAGEYERSRREFERIASHPQFEDETLHRKARILRESAQALLLAGEDDDAVATAAEAATLSRDSARVTVRGLPERQALSYVDATRAGISVLLSATARGVGPPARSHSWDVLARSRALVLDEMASRRRTRRRTADPEVGRLTQELSTVRTRLANLTTRALSGDSLTTDRTLMARAWREKEALESALAEQSAEMREELKRNRIGLDDILASLPPRSVLLAYAKYSQYAALTDPCPPKSASRPCPMVDGRRHESTPSYLAFVITDTEDAPTVVPLGPAIEIENLVSRFRKDALTGLTAYRLAGDKLRKKIWDPVASHVKEVERLFVVPDGALNLVNFAALPSGNDGYLVETVPIVHYLSTERDLVPVTGIATPGNGLLVMGSVAFDEIPTIQSSDGKSDALTQAPAAVQIAEISRATGAIPEQGRRSSCGAFQSLRFESLPETEKEMREVARLWGDSTVGTDRDRSRGADDTVTEHRHRQITYLEGPAASEAALKRLASGHRVIHLATHGFFLGGSCPSGPAPRAIMSGTDPSLVLPESVGENPLLLSGLALAGANLRDAIGPEQEDGILTAEEVATLDLSGVEWAVLSACDTGIGTLRSDEGIFGLRRAFRIAGARTVIISLLRVSDEATRQWMTALYEGRMIDGLDTAQAVHQASLKLLRQRRQAGESPHPFYWAGFIASGDWR